MKSSSGRACSKSVNCAFVLIASNQALDYNKLNEAISSAQGQNLEEKVENAMGSELADYDSSVNRETINLDFRFDNKVAVAAILYVDK